MPVSASYSVRTIGFKQLAAAMAVAVPLAIRTNLQVAFLAAGNIVAEQAMENISPYATSVADSIKVRMSGLASVRVVSGGNGLDIAGLMELGNKGSKGSSTFRHPVFGNSNVGISQPTHPYLAPALASKADEVEILIEDALDVAIAEGLITDFTHEDPL